MTENLSSKKEHREYCDVLARLLTKTTNPKLGLARVEKLLELSGFDHKAFKIIQVVGTNGKGSTVAFIESILEHHDVKTGLFTSPHLCSARERIRLRGQTVSKKDFIDAAHEILHYADTMEDDPSFFECMLAMAIVLFQKHGVDVAILEAGLGGRLDATTATYPDLLGLSMIDLDHQHILGSTIEAIATEKIAAAHHGQTVVTVKQVQSAKEVIEKKSKEVGFNLVNADLCEETLGLIGAHQKMNAGLAIKIVDEIGIKTTPSKIKDALLKVDWPGRFEIVSHDPLIVFDGAHNPSGIVSLINCLKNHEQFKNKKLLVVYGSLKSDNSKTKIELLVKSDLLIERIFLHQPDNTRAMLIDELRENFLEYGYPASQLDLFREWESVRAIAQNISSPIVVCGSLYTVGALRGAFLSLEMDPKMPSF